MSQKNNRILLGEITSVHGIKGEVVIRSYAANPQDIAAYGDLTDEAGKRRFTVKPLRTTSKGVVARVAGIEDRTSAETLRGTKLYIDRDRLPEPESNAFYVTDLTGLTVIDTEGNAFGKVLTVQNHGAGDILEVSIDGLATSELVPFTDACVPNVDVAAGHVTVVLPQTIAGEPEETDDRDAENS